MDSLQILENKAGDPQLIYLVILNWNVKTLNWTPLGIKR